MNTRLAADIPVDFYHDSCNLEKNLMELRSFIANIGSYFRLDKSTPIIIRDKLIKSNFYYHYRNNQFYRRLCDDQGVSPEKVDESVDNIPLVPIRMFKSQNTHLLLTKKISEIESEIRSTGTSGIPSVSRRDSETVDNISLVLTSMYREFFKISHGCGLFLCPSPIEMPEMGMVKAFNFLSGLLDDRVYLVRRYNFKSTDALRILEEWQDRFDRYIIGPPFMVSRLLTFMKKNDIRITLDAKSKIIMLGGWKRFTGELVSRKKFDNLCMEYLGVEKHQIRDMYGLVECNFLAIECEHNQKHVPPWVKVVIRDIDNPSKIIRQSDKSGLITILDPTILSYPCFIQTEDIGRVGNDGVCTCGRISQTLSFRRRIRGAELGCCAVNIEKHMGEEVLT
jgi:long-chain-fatty-acid---luciferin-component ligase